MKALVKTRKEAGCIELQNVDYPKMLGDDWVVIKVNYAGICGSDIHIWKDNALYNPPMIMGHEFSGEIVETGKDVKDWKKGDRVVAEPHTYACGKCELCRQGKLQICKHKSSIGWGAPGCFAEYIAMPEYLLHKIPDGLSTKLAAMCEPMAITMHQVVERCGIALSDYVLVTGSGPIGILSAFIAKSMGAEKVIMTGLDAGELLRFEIAREMGIDVVVNVQKENLEQVVNEQTKNEGIDVFIETSGSQYAIAQGLSALKKSGKMTAIGLSSKDTIDFPWNLAMNKRIDLIFNYSSSYTAWEKSLKFLNKHQDTLNKVITQTIKLDNWERAFNSLTQEKEMKVLIEP